MKRGTSRRLRRAGRIALYAGFMAVATPFAVAAIVQRAVWLAAIEAFKDIQQFLSAACIGTARANDGAEPWHPGEEPALEILEHPDTGKGRDVAFVGHGPSRIVIPARFDQWHRKGKS